MNNAIFQLDNFEEEVDAKGTIPPDLLRAKEKININIKWMEKNFRPIISWLNNRNFTSELVVPPAATEQTNKVSVRRRPKYKSRKRKNSQRRRATRRSKKTKPS